MHIVLDDFGNAGRAYRETAEGAADFDTVVDDLMGPLIRASRFVELQLGERAGIAD